MKLHILDGAPVTTADGSKLGKIDGIVVDPLTHDVSSIVVKAGLLSSRRLVVPLDAIRSAREDDIELDRKAGDAGLQPLTDITYVQTKSEPVSDRPEAYQQPSQLSSPTVWLTPPGGETEDITTKTESISTENLPDRTITLSSSTAVYVVGRHRIGAMAGIVTSSLGQITELVVTPDTREESIVVPVQWIDELTAAEVRLGVTLQLSRSARRLSSAHTEDDTPND